MRQPVHDPQRVRVLGIDSGFATLGLAVVEGNPELGIQSARLVRLEFHGTKKSEKKVRRMIRVCTDDARRIRSFLADVGAVIDQERPVALAVEWYQPNPKQGGFANSAWKAAITVGALLSLGRSSKLAVLEQLPADVKRLVGNNQASKLEVQAWLCAHLAGFEAAISKIAASKREHPADAAAHALIALSELAERRRDAAL